MRGRETFVAADRLTAELRQRLAETHKSSHESPAAAVGTGNTLGAHALRIARMATAMHMAESASQHAVTGEAPVSPQRRASA